MIPVDNPCRRWFVALAIALSAPSGASADIVITEIHYAPVDEAGQARSDLEFVELFNDGPEPYDLFRYRFSRGIQFEFVERTFIPGRGYLVVSRNRSALVARYGNVNAVGDFVGALDNAGEAIELSNPQGIPVCRVSYNDGGRWPAGARGTGHSLSIVDPYTDPSDPDSWALSAQMGGSPGAANFATEATYQDTPLIEVGENWRYFKGTREPSTPVTAWRQVGFSDATWSSGPTGIGYGDGDDATVLSDMQDGYMTIFCRKTFQVADPSDVDGLVLSITYDDGFYAFLNGTEVASRNVSGTAYNAAAPAAIEPTPADIDLTGSRGLLVAGTNVLAVQVHNAGLGSSDLSFIPRLVSRKTFEPTVTQTVPVVINEGFLLDGGAGGRFIELHNTSESPVALGGYYLTDDFANLEKHRIADGTLLPARGFLAFSEAQLGWDLSIAAGVRDRVGIALTNPAGTRVVDAVIFKPGVSGRSEARIPDGGRRVAPAADPTPGQANRVSVNRDVIFNEIMYHPIGETDSFEFIELFNRGVAPADIGDWTIDGVGLRFPSGTILAPGAYIVVGGDPQTLRRTYDLGPEVLLGTPWTGSLRDSGERLDLLDANGNVVDSVRFHDGGEWSSWADGGGSSLERIDPHAESDEAGTWDSSDDSSKAVVRTISYANVPYGGGESDFGILLAEEGIVIVDDITLTRTGTSTNLVTNPTFDSGSESWRFEGTHIRSGRTTRPSEVISGSGSLKLICWNGGGDYKVNRVETDTSLQTSGTYTVSFKARWVVGSPRIITIGDYNVGTPQNPGLAGSNLVSFPGALGTPGAPNSVTLRQIELTGSENIGPSIDHVSHAPGVPEASEAVTISARVRDPDGLGAVTLRYATERPSGVFSSISMSGPDGDGIFTAVIPGQAMGVRVLFYIEAEDSLGAASRFPADILSRTHPPVLDPDAASAGDLLYCAYRHDTRTVVTRYHSFRVILDEDAENYLRTRRGLSNELVPGSLVFGTDKVYYNIGIRFAGSPWLRGEGNWGNSYSLRMPKDHWLHDRKRSFNLDQHGTDGRERVSHYLLRQSAGGTILPYYDFQSLVRLQINDVRTGTYEAMDKPNSQYTGFWFPDEVEGYNFEMDDRFSFNDAGQKTGNAEGRVLYPPYGDTSGGWNKENYRWYFSPRSRANEDSFDALQQMCQVLDARITPNSQFDQLVWNVLDVEEVLRVWAVRMNTDDWDTWCGNRGKNCYFYQSSADRRWRLVPWDLELTYGTVGSFGLPPSPMSTITNHFSEIQRMLNRPAIRRLYYGILAEQVSPSTGFFHSTFLAPYAQQLAGTGVDTLLVASSGGFIDQRANLIRGWISAAVYPQVRLRITTNGGEPFAVPGPVVDLEGEAPADVFYFAALRNGVLIDDPQTRFEVSTTSMTGWSLKGIVLGPGLNQVRVLGFGSRMDIVDQSSIDVTASGGWASPTVSSVSPAAGAEADTVVVEGSGFQEGVRIVFGVDSVATNVVFKPAVDPGRVTAEVPPGIAPGATTMKARNRDGQESETLEFLVLPVGPRFLRGDANLSGAVDVSDALRILLFLFSGVPAGCIDALDADDSGEVQIADALRVLDHLFRGGEAPPPPYPTRGTDPTRDDVLDCESGLP